VCRKKAFSNFPHVVDLGPDFWINTSDPLRHTDEANNYEAKTTKGNQNHLMRIVKEATNKTAGGQG